MNLESNVKRNKIKKSKIRFHVLGNSKDGLVYAYQNEQSMVIHFACCLIVLILGFICKLNSFEWAVCILLLGMIGATELINTSLEAVIDLITSKYHPLAKIGKDTASAAVFTFSIIAFACFLVIFIPKLLMLG